MADFKPTAQLRFVNRHVPGPSSETVVTVRILQQWWNPDVPRFMLTGAEGQWRDVPLVSEDG